MSPAGIGLAIASCTAYMTMNGVLNASVSAGSSHRAASVTCKAQRSSPVAAGLPACAAAGIDDAAIAAPSATAKRMDTDHRERTEALVSGMAHTLVWPAGQINRSLRERRDRVDRTAPRG